MLVPPPVEPSASDAVESATLRFVNVQSPLEIGADIFSAPMTVPTSPALVQPIPVAAVRVSRVIVNRFRCIKQLELDLEDTTTVLVGENNAGKTSILLAIATALGRRRPQADDLHRDASGVVAGDSTIDVFFSPENGTSFSDEMRQRLLAAVYRIPGTTQETVGVRTTLRPSGEGTILSETRAFLQPTTTGWVETSSPPFQAKVLDLCEAQSVDASRDLLNEMGNQTSSWGRVLSDLQIQDRPDQPDGTPDPQGKRGLEADLKAVSDRVRTASPVLSSLHTDLLGLVRAQPSVGGVNLMALPLRIEELAKSIEVVVQQAGAADLPLRFHGLGSRSLAALLVFKTLCSLRVGADRGVKPHLITLLEEPEAHLHPHAITALQSAISDIPGQRILSTHSPTLVAEVPAGAVRVLRRQPGGVVVNRVVRTDPKKIEQFRRFFGRPYGELFFSRLVVFGDGPTERNALPLLVEMALGKNAAALGISFVDCRSMSNYKDLNPVIAAIHELQIPWIVFPDSDQAGVEALGKLEDPDTGAALHGVHPAVVLLPSACGQMEKILVDAGFQVEVQEVAADRGQAVPLTDQDCIDYLARNKGWAAEAVVVKAMNAGKSCPPQLQPLMAKIVSELT